MTPSIKIILVDDHNLFIDGLLAVLEKEKDIEVLATFLDARKAIEGLTLYNPELIITDISMPNMNGIEFIEEVKKKYPSIKILVASTFEQMISSKIINGYILKDANSEEFIKAIKEIVLYENSYFGNETNMLNEKINKSSLTKREKEIVALIAKEKTVNEIAEILFLSRMTVETHKKNIFLKLHVKTNAGLVKKAIFLGIIP